MSHDISADVAVCTRCAHTIYRTNGDGRWHHPAAPFDEHAPVPEKVPCDACGTAGVTCNLTLGERYCDGSPADVVDTPI
jgi:hypothetical protein